LQKYQILRKEKEEAVAIDRLAGFDLCGQNGYPQGDRDAGRRKYRSGSRISLYSSPKPLFFKSKGRFLTIPASLRKVPDSVGL
jgi:hypothetical protein